MVHIYKRFYFLLVTFVIVSLASCGSSDSGDDTSEPPQAFSVQVSPSTIELLVGQQSQLNYLITNATATDVTVSINQASQYGSLTINNANQTMTFIAGNQVGSDEVILEFSNGEQSVTVNLNVTITSNSDGNDGGDGSDDGNGDGSTTPSDLKFVKWPSDYITLFEGEEVTLNLNRNFAVGDPDVIENFYMNAANMTGQLSEDKTQYTIKAGGGESDTYGELLAVTEVNGIVHEELLQIIFYNKNRDLTTDVAPVIALIEPELTLSPGVTNSMVFDVYDPDSDRISYRVISSPINVNTHVHRTAQGFELSASMLSTNDSIDSQQDAQQAITLEVSDAHLTHQVDIAIIEAAEQSQATNLGNNSVSLNNEPPKIFIEENVTVSLIKELSGQETDTIATFAYVLEDETPNFVELSATSTNTDFTFEFNYPYVSVFADDVSNLEDEQVTLIADDGSFQSKLTFHLYVQDNYTEFLGGNVNVAPIIEADPIPPVLETKSIQFDVSGSDFEGHDFTISARTDESYVTALVDGMSVNLTTMLLAETEAVTTDIELIATDVFGSARSLSIPLEIYKNTPPVINTDAVAVDIVSGASLSIPITVNDVDEEGLTPEFIYDDSDLTISFANGIATIEAASVDQETSGSVIIRASDEFGATTEIELPLIIRINNQPPSITVASNNVTIAPGQSESILLTYADPDGTALTISRFTSDPLLTFSYNQTSGELTLSLDPSAEFQQSMTFTTIASDGFIEVSETITVDVPVAPEPPSLNIELFNPSVSEGNFQIINFEANDVNGDNVIITTADGGNNNVDELVITQLGDSLRIDVPDNVLSEESYLIEIIATDDSSSQLSTSQVIEITAIPENDPPEITLSQPFINLINDYQVSLPYTIVDIDNSPSELTIQVLDANFDPIPNTIDVVGFDINGIILRAQSKGAVINNEEIVIRVTDADNTSSFATLLVNKSLENDPPEIDYNFSPKLIDMGDNSSINVIYYFDDPDIHDETNLPEDTVSVVSVDTDNQFGNENVVSISNLTPFSNRVEFTINTQDVVLADTESRTPVSIAIILTDGYVSVLENIQVDVRDEDL